MREDRELCELVGNAGDKDVEIVAELALSPQLPEDLARRLARHPDVEVRDHLARNDDVAPEILAELLHNGGDAPIRTCGACRAQPRACADHEAGRRRIQISTLDNPSTPIAGMAAFAGCPEIWGRRGLAERQGLDPEIYRMLAQDPEAHIRGSVAENPSIPVALMESLGQDPETEVRRAVVENPAVPLDLMARLACVTKLTIDLVPRMASASETELRELAASPRAEVRALVACRPDLPADLLAALLGDPAPGVGKRLARLHPLEPDQLRDLARRHGPRLYASLARNPGCPADLLHTIANDVRHAEKATREVARHPNTDPELLRTLIQDPRSDVRLAAWGNPSLPVDVMRLALLGDSDRND